jgi:hypothetical protein
LGGELGLQKLLEQALLCWRTIAGGMVEHNPVSIDNYLAGGLHHHRNRIAHPKQDDAIGTNGRWGDLGLEFGALRFDPWPLLGDECID